MTLSRRCIRTLCCFASLAAGAALGQSVQEPYQPSVGQAGKNVVWVPTPPALVEKMLDMAQVTPDDVVMDLGSGDGRNIIAAAKRGARAHGIEYNGELVELSKSLAAKERVSDRATFERGDVFAADFSKATVVVLFLTPEMNIRLRPK
ncbi:MAG: methyltransferase domain-containing protein, partial [Pseudomonadota bacterium]|nr:methyltransferase domain-containing protein [Pseudomonadota bacterium]